MKYLILLTLALLLITCGPATQNTGENTEAEETSKEEQAESSSEYALPSEEEIQEDIPGRALEQTQDVLSKGDPYINEKNWQLLIAASEKVQSFYETSMEEQEKLYKEYEEKMQEAGQSDQEKIAEMQKELNEKVKELTPSSENIEPIVKQEGFESLEQAKEMASRARKIESAYTMLMSLEVSMETQEIGKEVSKQPALAVQKKAAKKMSQVAKEASGEQIQAIKEKFAEYSFTRKDFELFAKYKENFNMYALGAMYLAEIELE
jgi:hypothetical protein